MLAAGSAAQQPLAEFQRRFLAGVRAAEEARTEAEFEAALAELRAAGKLAGRLPRERRAQAAWFVGVRQAELLLRAGRLKAAREVGLATRASAAKSPGVYRGYYRVLVLLVLWRCMPEAEFFARLSEWGEDEYVLSERTEREELARAPNLRVPLRVLRGTLRLRRGCDRQGLEELQRVAEDLRAMDSAERSARDLDVWRASCLHELASYWFVRGDYDRALVYLEELPEDQSLYLRAQIAGKRGRYADAERLAARLWGLPRRSPFRPQDAVVLQLWGDALEPQGRFEEAEKRYRGAWKRALHAQARAAALNGIGDCERGLGRLAEAERAYAQAETELASLEGAGSVLAAATRAENWKDRGLLAEAQGEPARAYECFARSLEIVEEARADIPIDLLGARWLEPEFLPAVDGLLRNAEGRDPFEVLAFVDRCKARELLDWVRGAPRTTDLGELRAAMRALLLSDDVEQQAACMRRLEKARAAAGGGRRARALEPGELRRMIGAARERGVVFLSYWAGRKRVWVFVCEGGTDRIVLHDLGDRRALVAAMRRAYETASDPGRGDPRPALRELASRVFAGPVARVVAAGRHVVVSPGPGLERLPFEALPLEDGPLGVSHPVERAPSLAVRAALAERRAIGDGAVVVDSVSAPAFEARFSLDPLRYSVREGDAVQRSYRPCTRVRGAEATYERLCELLAGTAVDIVHVSAHAITASVPTSSLLLLADGQVSMPAMASLPLRGALLVLSACRSARGESAGGEGVLGVLCGALGAGARAVIASQWDANQQATADLMGQFHYFRSRGRHEAEALRAARERLASSANYAHPYYWAGFSIYGGGTPPATPARMKTRLWGWVGAAVVVAGLAAVLVRRRRTQFQGSRS